MKARFGEAVALTPPVLAPPDAGAGTGFGLTSEERMALWSCFGAAMIAYLFPFPLTKVALGLGLAVLFGSLSLRHFYIAVALFAFFLPLQMLLPKVSFIIRGLNIETLFVLAFWILSRSGDASANNAEIAPRNALAKPLGWMIAVTIVAALHTLATGGERFGNLFADVKNGFIYSAFLFFTFRRVRDDRQRAFVLLFILMASTLTAAESLKSVMRSGWDLHPGRYRAVSMISGQPNLWGGFLAMYAFFFIAVIVQGRMTRTVKLLTYGALGVVLVNLIYTQSRGAWLAFGATSVIVAGMKARRMIVPLVLIAGALYLWTPEFAVDRMNQSIEDGYNPALLMKNDDEAQEAASRVIQWRSFGPLMLEYGLFGVGFGQYGRVYKAEGYDTKARSAHATPIEIGVEQGVVSLLVYFWLFLAAYRRSSALLKDPEASPMARVLALGLLGATICVVLSDLSGVRSRDGNVMAYYWVLAGITLNIPLGSERRGAPAPAAPEPQPLKPVPAFRRALPRPR
jgi:hypothetical protein